MAKKIVRAIRLVLIILVALVIAWVVGGNQLASRYERRSEGVWEATGLTIDQLVAEYPATAPNAAALELERLVAPLGIDMAMRDAEGRTRPSSEAAKQFQSLKSELAGWLDAQITSPHDTIEAAPPVLESFLADHAETLDRIEAHILGSGPLVWESDIGLGAEAPIPNLLGHITLERVLTVRALAAEQRGDRTAAERSLDAGWTLGRALDVRPSLISQLVSIAVARFHAGAVRKIPVETAVWKPRLDSADFERRLLRSFQTEELFARSLDELDEVRRSSVGTHPVVAALSLAPRWLVRPYLRICAVDLIELERASASALSRVKDPCVGALETIVDEQVGNPAAWNVVARGVAPNLASSWSRLGRITLDFELSRKVLEAREARDVAGAWASEIDGIEGSVCGGERWIYETTPESGMSLRFSRTLEWPEQQGPFLPMEHREGGAASGG